MKPEKQRAVILSEFGGYSMKTAGHTWNPQPEFSYRKFTSTETLTETYAALLKGELKAWIAAGLSAAIFTQTVDVEVEVNGYMTYDRELEKMDFERLSALLRQLFESARH